MPEQMLIRIDKDKKRELAHLAQAEGKNASQVLRELVDAYIQDRDMSSYIDDLWDRIRKKIKARRISPVRIPAIIREVRKSRP